MGGETTVDNNTLLNNAYYQLQQLLPSSKILPTTEHRTVDNDTVADNNKIQEEGHLNTASTGHFFPTSCYLRNKTPTPNGIIVQCANSSHMQAIDTGKLDIPSLPENATTVHVFPDMNTALISVPELCDADCLVNFQKSHVTIYKPEGKVIFFGRRDPQTQIWLVPLHPPNEHALSAYHQETKPVLTSYLHACAGYPTKAT